MIAVLIERDLLDAVQSLIGTVEDVDRNNRLTIVLTDLRTVSPEHEAVVPVVACLRSSDLLNPAGPFCGDIIYLDRVFAGRTAGPPNDSVWDDSVHSGASVEPSSVVHTVPQSFGVSDREELRAILSHELAHAAASSALLRYRVGEAAAMTETNDQIPSEETVIADLELPEWLNEGIAHSIEYCLVPGSKNLARRFDAFRNSPEQSPIFAADPYMPKSLRRSGCRAAAVSFLNPIHSDPGGMPLWLRTLLQFEQPPEQRLRILHSQSFSGAFRNWCLRIAALQYHERLREVPGIDTTRSVSLEVSIQQIPVEREIDSSTDTTIQLRGTAAAWYCTTSDCQEVVISASSEAELQVTVLRLSSKPSDRLYSNDWSSQFRCPAKP